MRRSRLLFQLQRKASASAKIQAIARGKAHRAFFLKLVFAAITVQRWYLSIYRKKELIESLRRAVEGPVVQEVYRQGVSLDSRHLTVIVFNCRGNFRIEGVDQVRGKVYQAFIYAPQAERMVNAENKADPSLRIRFYQPGRVARLLVNRLKMVYLSTDEDLRYTQHGKDEEWIYLAEKRSTGRVNLGAGLDRTLQDQSHVVAKYDKIKKLRSSFQV